MIGITAIIELIKTGFGFFQKKEQNKADLDAENSHEQNDITLEETKKLGFTWRSFLGYALTFIIVYNIIVLPILALMGVILPPVPLDQVWRLLGILIGAGG